jgi:hypothetical protein
MITKHYRAEFEILFLPWIAFVVHRSALGCYELHLTCRAFGATSIYDLSWHRILYSQTTHSKTA